ncbi:MAG: hypothetical protein F6K35_33415, partial [Okeania sp. SIO2H7]|nr:hypothetical protein [Okeania sp. SIO2H7]
SPLSKKAISLIESSSPSVILERLPEERLLLLITGIEPENRLDIINRQIRIDLAFVGTNSDEDEFALRQLAADALMEEKRKLLTVKISKAVELLKNPDFLQLYPEDSDKVHDAFEKSDFESRKELAEAVNLSEETVANFAEGKPVKFDEFVEIDKKLELSLSRAKEIYLPPDAKMSSPEEENIYTNFVNYGFYVFFSQLKTLVSGEKTEEVSPSEAPDLTQKFGPNSPELRAQLAEEIKRCKLPPEMEPLVVVTGFKKMETLAEAKIWRGLSKLADSEYWMEIPQSKTEQKLSFSMFKEMVSGLVKSFSQYLANNNDEDYFN